LFDIYGFKPVQELMLHHLVCKIDRMCRPSKSSRIVPDVERHPCVCLFPSPAMPVQPGLVAVKFGWRTSS
jgi:hypothetical protein